MQSELSPRSLRGRKYPYCKSATAVHFSVLFRCVVPTMRLKRTENCPRRATFSLRVFLPRRLLARISHQAAKHADKALASLKKTRMIEIKCVF